METLSSVPYAANAARSSSSVVVRGNLGSHFEFWACPIPNFRNLILNSQFPIYLGNLQVHGGGFKFQISRKIRQMFININQKNCKLCSIKWFDGNKSTKRHTKFCWNIEIWAMQKRANLVDLVKSFLTSILNNSLAKFGFDTAKNEPLKVWRKFGIWTEFRNLNG